MKEEKAIYEYLKRYHRGREKAVCSNELERLFLFNRKKFATQNCQPAAKRISYLQLRKRLLLPHDTARCKRHNVLA